jgi:metal-dependent hydrolase (beta-lactamase superfamily II)
MFKSSLEKGGKNIVLFDTSKDDNANHENYQILNSYLHKVDNVITTSKKVLPKMKPAELANEV